MADSTPKDPKTLKIPELRKQAEEALVQGRLEEAQALAQALSQRRAIGAWDKVVLGRIALAGNDPRQAVQWFSQAHDDLPDEGSILVDLASAWAARKKWSTAAETLTKAIDLRPTVADLHERHAIYLGNMGKQEEASLALERALALNGTHPGAWALTGERQMAIGDFAGARQSLFEGN